MTRPKMQEPVRIFDESPEPGYPVFLDELKSHMRVDSTDDDSYIETLIVAATQRIDGWNGELGRALITQTWRADYDMFPGCRRLDLPLPPVQSVVVNYFDSNNVEQEFSGSNFSLREDAHGPYLHLNSDQDAWPDTYEREDAVRITLVSGYGANATDVPYPIRIAIMHIAANWYENREPVIFGKTPAALPMAADALLYNFRRHKF